MEKYLPDTSVIIEELISKLISEGKIKDEILIPNEVIAELEHQANTGQNIGLIGLAEIKKLRELSEQEVIKLTFVGERPEPSQIRYAKQGEIDAAIRKLAQENKATLVTADLVQAESAKAFGINVMYFDLRKIIKKLGIEEFFDNKTMSIHLKAGVYPMAKRGKPGSWDFVKAGNKELTQKELEDYAKEIMEQARIMEHGFIEVDRRGSTIAQIKDYRIVITRPPFSEGWEITVVKPLVERVIKDYKLSDELIKRFDEEASGIIICGAPGAGKSTFAEALAKHYLAKGRIIKTIEAPRDLQLPLSITQYSKKLGTNDELYDILLLTRPDHTLFDEIRVPADFRLYADLRLAGIGLVGVIHGTSPIDAIQRFIGKLELGMLSSILDTIVFIQGGEVSKVYSVSMKVKVPRGMYESDLSRPVIEVMDSATREVKYEIYKFGDETIVMPTKTLSNKGNNGFEEEVKKIARNAKVKRLGKKAIIKVNKAELRKLIGSKGDTLRKLEKKYGLRIEVVKV